VNNLWDYRPGVWDYRESTWTLDRDLVRYDVEAKDGCVGTIDHAMTGTSSAYVVVDLGSWVAPGAKRLIPAGAITALDHDSRKVHLALTQEEVGEAPDYDPDRWTDDERVQHGRYYGSLVSA
jgi:hypothetical protein